MEMTLLHLDSAKIPFFNLGLGSASQPWKHECPFFLLLSPSSIWDVQGRQARALRGTKQVILWEKRPDKSKEADFN